MARTPLIKSESICETLRYHSICETLTFNISYVGLEGTIEYKLSRSQSLVVGSKLTYVGLEGTIEYKLSRSQSLVVGSKLGVQGSSSYLTWFNFQALNVRADERVDILVTGFRPIRKPKLQALQFNYCCIYFLIDIVYL